MVKHSVPFSVFVYSILTVAITLDLHTLPVFHVVLKLGFPFKGKMFFGSRSYRRLLAKYFCNNYLRSFFKSA